MPPEPGAYGTAHGIYRIWRMTCREKAALALKCQRKTVYILPALVRWWETGNETRTDMGLWVSADSLAWAGTRSV